MVSQIPKVKVHKTKNYMSTFYNVVTRKVIRDGKQEKILHHKVGTVKVTPNGGWFLQLFMLPDVEFQIFNGYDNELPTIDFSDHEA